MNGCEALKVMVAAVKNAARLQQGCDDPIGPWDFDRRGHRAFQGLLIDRLLDERNRKAPAWYGESHDSHGDRGSGRAILQ